MNRFRSFTLIAVIAALVATGMAYAQGPGAGGPRGRGPGGPGGFGRGAVALLRGLDLTDAQREQVRQLRQQHREQTRALAERFQQAQDALRHAVEAVAVDEARIRTAMQQVAEVQTELTVLEARLQSDIHALLTPEQQQKAEELRAARESRMKERRERMKQRMQERQQPQGQ